MNDLGKQAENAAAEYLQKKGYRICFRNYRFGRLEVDIVCEYKDQIIIIEVKALSSIHFKRPYESVSKIKQRKIIKVSDYLLNQYYPNHDCRFDIVSIFLESKQYRIEHITDAFSAGIHQGY